MPNKPKWVEALESAEKALRSAEQATDTAEQGSRNAMAHTWLAIAREYRDSPATGD